MYKSIFVPLDGSEFSARAIPVATTLARRTGAAVHLAVVFDPSTFVHFAPSDAAAGTFHQSTIDRYCSHATAWVEQQAAALSNTGLACTGALLEGTVVEALAEYTVSISADIVVMTTHGRSGVDRLWLGSVASSFLLRSSAPVLLVRPSSGDSAVAPDSSLAGTLSVPLDGSSFAEAILPKAMEFARTLELRVELVTVVMPVGAPLLLFGTDVLAFDDGVANDQLANARSYLDRIAATLQPAPDVTVLSDPRPARALIDHAARSHSAVIALATHGGSGIARLIAGSVADKLLRGTTQPLLVLGPDASSTTRENA